MPAVAQTPAKAGTIETLRARAAGLASEIDGSYAKLSVLDEAYNQARTSVSELKTSVADQNLAIGTNARRLARDNAHLRAVAVDVYVNGASGGLSVFLNGNQQQLPMQQAYLSAASGNLAASLSGVQFERHQLEVHRQQLQRARATELASLRQIAKDVNNARAVTASLDYTLSQVKGQLAQAVAAQEKAQAAAALAAAAAAVASQPPPPPPPPPPAPPPAPSPASSASANPANANNAGGATAIGGGAGEAAVRAAESQLGVPYVWGGATPGAGFDCSGLTMWSWAQAGVQLAHGATEQYYEIAHVSMSALQPGDLIFYGDAGYLYHVVMYVGSGPYGSDTVVQAEETGTNVMYSPMPPGAYGAGQP